MAGESPDRSKQRESSAEPTSGSAGSVPEARDPRRAVSREKDSSGGGRVDTATTVLSVRGARPAAVTEPTEPGDEPSTVPDEDADLRTAVSAWVRGAETPKPDPGTSAQRPTPAEPNPTGTGSPTASAEGRDTAPGTPSAEPASTAAAKTAPAAGTKADADVGASAESEPTAKADVAAKGTSKRRTGTRTASKADAGTKSEPGTKSASKAGADAETGTDTGVVGAAPKTPTKGRAGTKARPGAKARGGAAGGAVAGGAQARTTKDVPEARKTRTEPKTADARPEAADAEDRPEAADGRKEPEAAAKTGPKVAAKAVPATAAAKTGPKVAAKAVPATASGEAAAEAEVAGGAEPEGAVDAEVEPEAADGGGDPQGPPAGDDESRTGGAGGKSKAADGGAEALDQATAVFKAVRPKKPEVDQPTTMLKLGGGKPKPPESESERTSKFVALRDDMRPGGKTPAPTSTPAPATTSKPKPKPAPASVPDATTPVPQVGPERTTQQPLPPKPPLDLLAELTNTPPPPETPVRTLVRRVKIWTPLVLLLVVVLAVVQAFRPLPPPALALTAEGTYTFDGDPLRLPWPGEGQGWVDVDGVGTMGHFGKQTPVAIGSVAKTMTAYIVLKDHPLKRGQEGPKIEVDAKAEKEGGYDKDGESTLNTVKAGDHLTEKQALSAVMIPSANNIARLLARWDAGSEAAFVKKMNATARELGMKGTRYTDPSGLKETTVSTAQDQVKLGRAVVKVPALVDITSAASWTDPSGRNWPNYNELPYRIGALGIKTGTTTAAGGNLLFASRKQVGGQAVTVVGAILDQQKPPILTTANEVSKTALLAAQKALTPSKILKKGDVVGYVDDRLGGRTPVVVTKDVSAVGWSGLKVSLSFTSGTVPHTAKAGTQVGSLTVGDGSAGGVRVPVALEKDLAEPGLGAKLTRIG
ncbi:D-alanyl-D-alanine carboxypeptidase [Streptomyces dangxiongensis]|uniref:D-alanyl-D-alanine carboxypeptidase n=1 Tax=Streptomyces dangxiongensis TaxID=1442032 RepID=UPI001F09B312|nr:D-alanyl-D-alanine carboxypeptidase [Streptomyces dangxiongensis]